MADLISFEEFKEFWEQQPIVVIDSCSLLDLYRYAPRAAKKILDNLKEIQDSIWLPSQVLEEYLENKATVIKEAHKKYENVSAEVEDIVKKAEKNITSKFNRYGKFKYPQISTFRSELEEITSSLKEKAKSFKDIVATEIRENKAVLKEDEVNEFIKTLKESNQIGLPFSLPKRIELYREGELRYSHLIPPGYEDIGKDLTDPTKTRKYGDLIIWKELLKKSADNESPFIFITDDEKEDWWDLKRYNTHLGSRDELLGPRPELVSEFNEISTIGENGFLMLTLPEFNKHISKINEVNLKEGYLSDLELSPEDVVKEIIDVKDWSTILDGSGELTTSFIHDGELQELTGEILTDVEIVEFLDPEFDDLYVDYNDEEVIIEGRFSCVVLVSIETALSREYSEWFDAKLILNGNISIEFNIIYDGEKNEIERRNENVVVSNIEINEYESESDNNDYSDSACISCGVRPGDHFTKEGEPVCGNCVKNFEVCTECGYLFEAGTLGGSKCQKCDD
ncbi:hypothetical protein COJ85_11695 [Bacillus sp. AFS076308]|uniref:PIN-like domain-containing protein n=1 Tax=Bacillus sp. AFS076308 TaxID=2033512 RepID=UPI000BF86FFF|nr:PIN domain-containing protein [Bacillus sp. AFS076308]PFO04687.1 hypothetical protein COJ85_11695 [Bacillus sp. AFS076308]